MYNQNSTHISKLASSIQRDYQQAAYNHRLVKESGYEAPQLNRMTTFAMALTTIIGFIATLTQFVTI